MFAEHRYQLDQMWNGEGYRSLYQAFIMCEIVDPYTPRPARVACASDIKTKYYRENCKRCYEVQIEESYMGRKFQRAKEHAQSGEKNHVQVSVSEVPKKTQE